MKTLCKRLVAAAMTLTLALGLAVPAMAYTTPDFSDVPSNHWAYESVMKMADAGVIKGTGGGMFSPDMKLSAEMFVVLVGRVVFPDVKAEGADWSGPYVTEAKAKGLLDGTNVTDANLTGEISRYDMAVILAKCVELLKVSATKADSSKVTDYGEVPTKYVDAVLMAYGSGLIRGDQSGSFNGANSMTRQEAATVMDRLLGMKGNGSQGGGTTEPDPTEPPPPDAEETATYTFEIRFQKVDHVLGAPANNKTYNLPNVPVKVYYTPDGGETSILAVEGTTGELNATGGIGWLVLSCEGPKSWGDPKDGKAGFYYSAETTYEGQRLVTSDLRTDGRAYADIARCAPNSYVSRNVELTPPEGLKIHFTFAGRTEAIGRITVPNTTVQLFLKDGTLINETVSGPDGRFEMECEVDILDGVLNLNEKIFQVVAYGELNGISMSQPLTYYGTDEPVLFSLERLGGNSHSLNFPNGSYCVILE